MRYGIVGMGAVGSYFGAKLQLAGAEVHFLRRSAAAQTRQHGLKIFSVDGDIHLPQVHVYDTPQAVPPCDAVLVTLKATQNAALALTLPAMLAPQGVVLVLQNGLNPEADAAAVVGAARVIGAPCLLCAATRDVGVVDHLGQGSLTMGLYDKQASTATRALMATVQSDLQQAGVPTAVTDDLTHARWLKLVWNIPFNGLSSILRASTHGLLANPHSRALVLALMQEVRQAARAVGVFLPETIVTRMLQITEAGPDYKSSMLVDTERGLPLEVEAIVGAPLQAALRAGASLPHLTTLYGLVAYLSAQQRGAPAHV